jgi:hypothetical protein
VIRYGLRAVPWPIVWLACGLAGLLMAAVAAWPSTLWPLQGAAVGVLAAAAGRSLNEPSAAVVDTLPRSLQWRTAGRALVAVPLGVAWALCVLAAGDRLPPHRSLFLAQGLIAVLFAVAFVSWRRAAGSAEPGSPFAVAVIAVTTVFAVLRPAVDHLPVFPIWAYDDWALAGVLWGSLALASVLLLVKVMWPTARFRAPTIGSGA